MRGAAGSVSRMRALRLGLLVGLAVVMAVAGWLAGTTITSPEDAARGAGAPEASPITVPVERRVIETAVVVRGDVVFAVKFDLSVDSDLGEGGLGQQVVTGRLPAAGSQLAEGAVAIEVSGRPVFVLEGALPMYRGLRPGAVGADVLALESALKRLGFFAGTPDNRYDQATAAAVKRMYDGAGYAPIGLSAAERQQQTAAQQQVDSARAARVAAEQALAAAVAGPPRSTVLAAQGEVEQAQMALDQAQAAYDQGPTPARAADLAAARNRLAVAQAALDELMAPADTTTLRRAVDDAKATERAAQDALTELSTTLGYRVPRGEIVFVPSLPRQVSQVTARLGDVPSGPVLSLTATTVQVDIALSTQEKKLVAVGAAVRLDDQVSGVDLTGTVAAIADSPGTDGALPGTFSARVQPDGGDPQRLAGLNLRVTIPVRSTGGPVLAVPVAALVTDASGKVTVRVREVVGGSVTTRDVPVTVGLSSDGFAQVEGDLAEGDLVIVGNQW
jgi:peptidoglycan hydrolase-like protein with peptidoglycan-binding domain